MALPSVTINLNPVVLQRVEASTTEERSFVVNPFDINGNVINSIYVEVATNVVPPAAPEAPAPFAPSGGSANVILPNIASLKGNSNIKITIVNIGGLGTVSAICGGADSIGGSDTRQVSAFSGNLVFTIANDNAWSCIITEAALA
jgi:hypothetical protein